MRDPRLLIMGLATFALSSFYWLRIFGQPLFISLMFNWISGFLVGTWLVFDYGKIAKLRLSETNQNEA